jgi:tRNA U34 2-thiouridine synthase MnmA/TrmU
MVVLSSTSSYLEKDIATIYDKIETHDGFGAYTIGQGANIAGTSQKWFVYIYTYFKAIETMTSIIDE